MACENIFDTLGGSPECYSNASSAIEKGKRFVLNNKSRKTVCRIRVDNCLIIDKQIKKCDFFFAIEETKKYYLVELKGQSIDDAVEQIKSTFSIINKKIGEDANNYVGIVVSSAVPKAADQKFKTLQQKMFKEHGFMIKRKQIHYQEDI